MQSSIRPMSYGTNVGPRMAGPTSTGLGTSQPHSVQQRQQFQQQQHGTAHSSKSQ